MGRRPDPGLYSMLMDNETAQRCKFRSFDSNLGLPFEHSQKGLIVYIDSCRLFNF